MVRGSGIGQPCLETQTGRKRYFLTNRSLYAGASPEVSGGVLWSGVNSSREHGLPSPETSSHSAAS